MVEGGSSHCVGCVRVSTDWVRQVRLGRSILSLSWEEKVVVVFVNAGEVGGKMLTGECRESLGKSLSAGLMGKVSCSVLLRA